MPLVLYMDVHIPRAITNGLRRHGVEVITAQEDGTAELDDPPPRVCVAEAVTSTEGSLVVS